MTVSVKIELRDFSAECFVRLDIVKAHMSSSSSSKPSDSMPDSSLRIRPLLLLLARDCVEEESVERLSEFWWVMW